MGCPRFAGKDWNGFIEEDLGDVLSESFRVGEVGWIADNSIIPMKEIEFEYRIHGLTYKIGLLNPDEIQELIDRLNKKFNVTCSIRDKNYLDVKSK